MNYGMRKLDGQGPFDVYAVNMASGSKFSYWKRNTTEIVRNAVVVFDNRNANIGLQDGMALLSLSGMNNLQEMYQAIRIFMANINRENVNIHFQFVVQDEKQRQEVEMVARNLGVSYEFKVLNKLEDNKTADLEDKLKNEQDITASGPNTIMVQKGTGIQTITISGNKAYVNSGQLSIEEEKFLLLQKWKQDPFMSIKIRDLDPAELDRLLTENVTMNLTAHRMESPRKQTADDEVGEVAKNKAGIEDGSVNTELGIVENNVSNPNQYSVVEQRGENVQVVNANVTNSSINSGGVSSSGAGDNGSYERESKKNAYGYKPKNLVWYDDSGDDGGKMYGGIGQEQTPSKGFAKTLKPPRKSAAFVSLPAIMFVLSAMLLIGSIILLFVLD